MPLPSVLNGALQCQVNCKRTGIRCKNPAAYGCKACRIHGAHKSRNVLQGANHPQYRHGGETKAARKAHQETLLRLAYLVAIGNHCNLFYREIKPLGRPPSGYAQLELTDPKQLAEAIRLSLAG